MIDIFAYVLDIMRNNLFSIIAAITALVALWQTNKQIKLSNKHLLYDRRVSNFIIVNGLIQLHEESKNLMKNDGYDQMLDVTVLFHSLTNNTYLKDIGTIIDNAKDEDIRHRFLIKLENLKRVSLEMEFLYAKCKVKLISDFIYEYQELLRTIYKYKIIQDKMLDANTEKPTEFEKLQKEFGEVKFREELYMQYDKIKNLYEDVHKKKSLNYIKNQIKL